MALSAYNACFTVEIAIKKELSEERSKSMLHTFHGGIPQGLKFRPEVPDIRIRPSKEVPNIDPLPPLDGKLEETDPEVLIERFENAKVVSPSVGKNLAAICRNALERSKEKRVRLVVDCSSESPLDFAYRSLVIHRTREVYAGIKILMRATNASEAVIVSDNSCLSVVRKLEALSDGKIVKLRLTEAKYPIHEERLLVYVAAVREMKNDSDPLRYGLVTVDAETCFHAYEAVLSGTVQNHRFVSVKNGKEEYTLFAPIGLKIEDAADFETEVLATESFPLPDSLGKEKTVDEFIRMIYNANPKRSYVTDCIGCDECEFACPMYLPVSRIVNSGKKFTAYEKYHFDVCLMCGCCSAVCPAGIEIRSIIKEGEKHE